MHAGFWWGDMREREHLEDLSIDGGYCIELDLHKVGRGAWTGLIWLRTGTVAGSCGCGNELMGFLKCGELLTEDLLSLQEGLCSIELGDRI